MHYAESSTVKAEYSDNDNDDNGNDNNNVEYFDPYEYNDSGNEEEDEEQEEFDELQSYIQPHLQAMESNESSTLERENEGYGGDSEEDIQSNYLPNYPLPSTNEITTNAQYDHNETDFDTSQNSKLSHRRQWTRHNFDGSQSKRLLRVKD